MTAGCCRAGCDPQYNIKHIHSRIRDVGRSYSNAGTVVVKSELCKEGFLEFHAATLDVGDFPKPHLKQNTNIPTNTFILQNYAYKAQAYYVTSRWKSVS